MSNNCSCSTADLGMINGNSIDVTPNGCDSEIKANIVVSEFNSVRLWGQIVNCNGQSVPNALLKLVKVIVDCSGKCVYQGIAHSVSDCNGFYQFDLCVDDPNSQYKVLVNKSAVGTERVIEENGGNCNSCQDGGYTPCGEYKFRVTPPDNIPCNNNNNNGCNNNGCNNNGCNTNMMPNMNCQQNYENQNYYQESCGCNMNMNMNMYNKVPKNNCVKQEMCNSSKMSSVSVPSKIRF